MTNNVQLTREEVLVGVHFPIEVTSVFRYQQVLNDLEFRRSNGIDRTCFTALDGGINGTFGPVYFNGDNNGKIYINGDEGELLSPDPIVAAYSDGGFEYLHEFSDVDTENPHYKCRLWIPRINSTLDIFHPIKNEDLISKLKK